MSTPGAGHRDPPRVSQPDCTAKYHGDYSAAQNHGCTCDAAVAERRRRGKLHRIYSDRGITLRVPAAGTLRRIQALQCLGYSSQELKTLLGRPANNKSNLWPRSGKKYTTNAGMMNRATAERWADLYDRICMTPATGPRARHVAAMAVNKGWAPPLAWDNIDDPDEKPHNDYRRLERKRATARARYCKRRAAGTERGSKVA